MRKQNIFDFLEEHRKAISKQKPEPVFDAMLKKNRLVYPGGYLVVIHDQYLGIATLKYPPRPLEQFLHEKDEELPRFEYVLIARDFPWRNMVPCYGKDEEGKDIILEWIDGGEAIPSPSLKRFLRSGQKRYIPKYDSRSADATNEDVKKLLTHGKYHFGSSVNI